jgi:ABC-type microcin C transport system permease subunit YejB
MIPTLFGAAVLVFFLMRLIPGDVCELRMAGTGAYFDEEVLVICRAEQGLDVPIFVQFVAWVWGFFQFDLGVSMWTGRPVSEEIALRFQLSLQVAIMATITAIIIAIPMKRAIPILPTGTEFSGVTWVGLPARATSPPTIRRFPTWSSFLSFAFWTASRRWSRSFWRYRLSPLVRF